MTPPWTIGIVNYKSAVYIGWQLRILYEANPPESFELVIVDNSRPHEREALERLAAPYRDRHRNIELLYHEPTPGAASTQHGEALELIRARVRTPYLLVHDPDFFWIRHGYLALLADLLERGNLAVGAPYPQKVGLGNPWFPAAFGCAYRTAALADLDFTARVTPRAIEESFARWPQAEDYGFSFDVGWRIRETLSEQPHLAFAQRVCGRLGRSFGAYGFSVEPREYRHEGRALAYHLFRGSFTGLWTEEFADPAREVPQAWLETRDRLGAYFYGRAKRDGRRAAIRRHASRLLARLGDLLRGSARGRAPATTGPVGERRSDA
jgi:hypothetical protein